MSRRGRFSQALGLAAGLIMVTIMLGVETSRRNRAGSLFSRVSGTNILAKAGVAPPAVVLVAHYDTINQGEAFKPGRVRMVPPGSYVQAMFPVLTIALGPLHRRLPGRLLRAAMLAGSLSMLQWQYAGGYNAGANDNGSGVAAALECALSIGRERAAAGDVWFLFTDGEEAGLAGMIAFCEAHRTELAGAIILNLESVGRGNLMLLGRESMLVTRRPPGWLLAQVHDCAIREGQPLSVTSRPAFATDALAALARGFPAATIAGLGERGLIEGWHYDDFLERIDKGGLEEASRFAAAVLMHLSSRTAGTRAIEQQ